MTVAYHRTPLHKARTTGSEESLSQKTRKGADRKVAITVKSRFPKSGSKTIYLNFTVTGCETNADAVFFLFAQI